MARLVLHLDLNADPRLSTVGVSRDEVLVHLDEVDVWTTHNQGISVANSSVADAEPLLELHWLDDGGGAS